MSLYLLTDQKHTYATPKDCYEQVELNTDTIPAFVITICEEVADRIDRFCRRHFLIETGVRYYDRPSDGSRLHFGADLLTASALAVGRTSPVAWVEETAYWLKPLNSSPKKWAEAEPGYSFRSSSDVKKAIAVTGDWGYVDRQISAVTTVGSGGIDASATTLPVASSSGLQGMLVEIGDERMYVTDEPTGTTATVERGVLGTTPASHSQSDDVDRKLPPADIRLAAVALFTRAFRQAQSGFTDVAGFQASGELVYSKAIPADVKATLESYRRTMFA